MVIDMVWSGFGCVTFENGERDMAYSVRIVEVDECGNDTGFETTVATNAAGEGLWEHNKQVAGTCQFSAGSKTDFLQKVGRHYGDRYRIVEGDVTRRAWTWTAGNHGTTLMGYRVAQTRLGAVRAAKAYLRDECGGEGRYTVQGYEVPIGTSVRRYIAENLYVAREEYTGDMHDYK